MQTKVEQLDLLEIKNNIAQKEKSIKLRIEKDKVRLAKKRETS